MTKKPAVFEAVHIYVYDGCPGVTVAVSIWVFPIINVFDEGLMPTAHASFTVMERNEFKLNGASPYHMLGHCEIKLLLSIRLETWKLITLLPSNGIMIFASLPLSLRHYIAVC